MTIYRAIFALLLACAVAPGLGRAAPAVPVPAPDATGLPPSITLAEARVIIDGAIAYAHERNALMAVAVLDEAGNLISSDRMDGAAFANVQYAEGKAFAAAMSRQTTETLSRLA